MYISTERMAVVTAPYRSKADKIRALDREGVPTAEIARFLGIRYQHAYNVLKRSRNSNEIREAPSGSSAAAATATAFAVRLDASHRIALPEPLRVALGLSAGDDLLARIEGDEVRLLTRDASLRRAQDIMRKYARPGESVVDGLISQRRREAEAENA